MSMAYVKGCGATPDRPTSYQAQEQLRLQDTSAFEKPSPATARGCKKTQILTNSYNSYDPQKKEAKAKEMVQLT